MFAIEFNSELVKFDRNGGFFMFSDSLTVAAQMRGPVYIIATAVCMESDRFDTAIGKAVSLERFINGMVCYIPVERFSDFIDSMDL